MNFAMAILGLKEIGKFLWEGREKSLPSWLSQFSFASQRNFPISFKPKVPIDEFFWKMQRKTWYSILGVNAMPLSLKNLLRSFFVFFLKKRTLKVGKFKVNKLKDNFFLESGPHVESAFSALQLTCSTDLRCLLSLEQVH